MTISMDDIYHLIEDEYRETIEQTVLEGKTGFTISYTDFETMVRKETGCCSQTVKSKWDKACIDSVILPYGKKYRYAVVEIDYLAGKTGAEKKIKKKIKKNIFAVEEVVQ